MINSSISQVISAPYQRADTIQRQSATLTRMASHLDLSSEDAEKIDGLVKEFSQSAEHADGTSNPLINKAGSLREAQREDLNNQIDELKKQLALSDKDTTEGLASQLGKIASEIREMALVLDSGDGHSGDDTLDLYSVEQTQRISELGSREKERQALEGITQQLKTLSGHIERKLGEDNPSLDQAITDLDEGLISINNARLDDQDLHEAHLARGARTALPQVQAYQATLAAFSAS